MPLNRWVAVERGARTLAFVRSRRSAESVADQARRLLLEIGIAVLLVVLLRAFVMQSFHVPSASMEPTIMPGDRVVVTKIGAGEIERGDVIVFDGTDTFAAADRTPFAAVTHFHTARTLDVAAETDVDALRAAWQGADADTRKAIEARVAELTKGAESDG